MIIIILILLSGIGTGFLLRRYSLSKVVEKTILATISALLFILGLEVGGNRLLTSHLLEFGWQALVFAVVGMAGSIALSYMVFHKYTDKKGQHEK